MSKSSQSGSETIKEKIAKKVPWLLGNTLHKPKIRFPRTKGVRRLSFPTPSKNLALISVYIFLFVLQLGVIYIIYREPNPLGADAEGNAIWIYPDIQDAFIIEAVVASILIFLCAAGFFTIFQATKYTYDKSFAWKLLLIGTVLVIISFTALQYMIDQKSL
jgi:hypothetical protein